MKSFRGRESNAAERFYEMRSDYDAAKQSRLRRRRIVPSMGAGADYHYRTSADYLRIMEYARDMDRNDVVMGSVVDRAVMNIIQGGATLDFDTTSAGGSKTLDEELLGGFNDWAYNADNIDIAGEETFCDMEEKSLRASLVDGDIFGLGTEDGLIQWFEGHRARSPSRTTKPIFQGIQLGAFRKPEVLWITKEDLAFSVTQTLVRDFEQYAIRDGDGVRRVFHVHGPKTRKRFYQTRGISAFAPMFDMIGMHDDVQFAAVLKQQIQNALIFFKERDEHYRGGPEEQTGEQTTETRDDGSVETIQGVGVGMMLKGKVGEKLKGFMPTVPGAEFFPHVKLILTLLGVNLGMPLVLVMMDASETNFSGWRGAFDQAKMGFRAIQRAQIRRFNDPALAFHLAMRAQGDSALARSLDKIRMAAKKTRIAWYCWHLPTWPYIQPEVDRKADMLAVANYQEAPSTNMARNGMDYDREISRCISDRGKAIEFAMREAKRLNEVKAGLGMTDQPDVGWDRLYTPPQPQFVQLWESQKEETAGKAAQPAGGKKSNAP